MPVLKRGHLWIMSLLYLATFGSFIGFRGLCNAVKTQFPDVLILQYAFFGPFIGCAGAFCRWCIILTVWSGTRVTLVNFILMAIFSGCCSDLTD